MCGIAGIVSTRNDINVEENLAIMLAETKHRGPDHTGVHMLSIADCTVALGMNRLSILDLSPAGNQPMFYENLIIVYNGEIYNYLEIRSDLEKKGHQFHTGTDTEVVLHAYKEWGQECINRFVGMFAAAIVDIKSKQIFFFRDRVGEKPLYYAQTDKLFLFSSELKGILKLDVLEKSIDIEIAYNYLISYSPPSPYTLVKGIYQLPAGCSLMLKLGNGQFDIIKQKYWELPHLVPEESLTEKKVLSDLEELLYNAVKIRLRSDVPVGVFLSGGIDSSLVTAIAARLSSDIRTYTIGYSDRNRDESGYAKAVASRLGVKHSAIMLDEKDANLDFGSISYLSDDGTANISLIPYFSLAKETRKDVKAVLSGDGGDEFFCGYINFRLMSQLYNFRGGFRFLAALGRLCPKAAIIGKITNNVDDIDVFIAQFYLKDTLVRYNKLFTVSPQKLIKTLSVQNMLEKNRNVVEFRSLNYYESAGNSLSNYVLKTTDRISMKESLEVRSVLTDHRLIEYMAKVPDRLVLKNNIDKYLLKKLLSRFLPSKFVFRRPKMGFSVPLRTQYKKKWDAARARAVDLYQRIRPDFLALNEVNRILSSGDPFDANMQSKLVFFIHYLDRWRLS